jgi:tetratricopeptide (TPR) repeat protein
LLRPLGGVAEATVGVVGTPAFMSPEQAAGKMSELGPATDVYSLGATLYALLTNRAPFKGPVVEVLKQVERGAWVPPREVNGSVPAALDAICRKAMALRPGDRYSSAQALAEDVEHFLADEPVAAYPEPRAARLRRWMRKRPRRVTAALVMLLTAVLGLVPATVFLDRSNREARENLEMIKGQADYLVQGVSEDLLLNEPGMQKLRLSILWKVLTDSDKFLTKRPGDRHARRQMADAKRQLGELYLQTGTIAQARALEAQAAELYEGLLRDAPGERELRFGLARAWYVAAEIQMQSGDSGEGKKEVDQSVEILDGLIAEEPGNGDYQIALARGFNLRATIEGQQGLIDSALADNKRVLEILIQQAPSTPKRGTNLRKAGELRHPNFDEGYDYTAHGGWETMHWPYVLLLGRACLNQGLLLNMAGRNDESARVLERAIAVHRQLLELNSRASPFRHGLALALLHSGRIQVQLGLPGKAEPALREALGLMRLLVQEDRLVKEFQATRLLAAGCLGESLFRQGKTAAAAELLREVEGGAEEVLAGPRSNRGLRGQYARLLHVLGCLECDSGNPDRGLALCRKAHEHLEQLLRETPGHRSLRTDWLTNREALARCRFLEGELTRAGWIAEQKAIPGERKDLAGQEEPSPRFAGEAARSAAVLAGLLLEEGRPAEALACIDGVLPAHEEIVRAEQERRKAAAKEQQKPEPPPKTPYPTDLLPRFLREATIVPDDSLHSQWAMLLACRGAALARVGRDAEAAEAVRQAVAVTAGIVAADRPFPVPLASSGWLWGLLPTLLSPVESCHLYDLACHQTLASTLPGANGRPDLPEQAVSLLRSAAAVGFDNLHRLRTDPALEPLRKREDFRQLVHDLETCNPGRKDAPPNP